MNKLEQIKIYCEEGIKLLKEHADGSFMLGMLTSYENVLNKIKEIEKNEEINR